MKKYFGKQLYLLVFLLATNLIAKSSSLLIYMDEDQKNHLKAYGLAYWSIKQQGQEVDWLLNYRGGSFLIKYSKPVEDECKIRGVSYQVLADAKTIALLNQISDPAVNMEMVKLEKAPKIAVYSPKSKLPWDDAVTLVLSYAEIPYDVIYDDEILKDKLVGYDWLHLHHEDFTGQYGKFWASFRNTTWYQTDVKNQEEAAKRNGFKKVSEFKLAVAKRIKEFCAGGGFLFAMCSGTDSFDIALAAEGVDIVENMFDGDGTDANAQQRLDYSKTLAFSNFSLIVSPYQYEFSDIDVTDTRSFNESNDFFTLFDFSAKWDLVPTMLTQNHEKVIKGFMGQTTAYRKSLVKPNITVLGENKAGAEVRYLHGEIGKGQFSFYGGHDPEDYQHLVNDPPTDLNLHPNSPGYRLILNNVLFPAAKKKHQKT
jgi:hypothetical protein